MPLGLRAIAEGPLAALLIGQVTVTETRTVRFASRSFTTRSADTPANEFVPGRLMKGLTLARRLAAADAGQFGGILESPSYGIIELANADGELDTLSKEYFADGQKLRVRIGATEILPSGRERVKDYSTFALVFATVAGPWSFEHDVLKLNIANLQSRLQDRFQVLTYAGTGGKTGTADLTGRTLPTALGNCRNIPCQMVDPTVFTTQLHASSMSSIDAVYDSGIALSFAQDVATYAALEAAEVPDGSYSSCIAEGFIKLGAAPLGTVTADCHGDLDNVNGTYSGRHPSIIRMVLRDYGGLLSSDLDLNSFTALDTVQPASCGRHYPAGDQSTVLDVVNEFAFSCGAFAGQDRSGLYRVQRLEAPAAIAHWIFTDREIIDIEQEPLPYGVPWKSWGVAYARNWTKQTGMELAAGVTQERRQFLEAEARFAYTQDPEIAQAHLTSSGAPLRMSLFTDQADALAEAQRLQAFYGLGRAVYRVIVKTVLFSVEIGQTVRLFYDRWDLRDGKNFVVFAIDDDADGASTTLRVFG